MNELGINLDPHSDKPLYMQIYEYLRDSIRRGELGRNDRLPSSRALSGFLGISRSTVETAYDQLLSEGYIVTRKNRGCFVCGIDNLYDLGTPEKAGGRVAEEEAAGSASGRGKAGSEPRFIDFSPRAIDMTKFPYETWRRLSRNIMMNADPEMFSLGEPNGDLSFRRTIARYLHLSRGVECDPENVVIGAGNDYLLMLLRMILGEGRRIGMEYVSYARAARIFRTMSYTVCPLSMDGSGMKAEALEENGCDLAYVMPAHQYPSGITMPIARRMELLAWAGSAPGRYLIEDDYDSEFRYRGRPIPPLQASDRCGRIIYIGTFSKSIAPAIRVSFMVLPQELMQVFRDRCGFFSSTVSRIDQKLLDAFLCEGYFERYLNRMRNLYRTKQELMRKELRSFESGFALHGEDAGLHVLLEERTEAMQGPEGAEGCAERERELVQRACAEGVRVYPMSENRIGNVPAGQLLRPTILLGFAALDAEEIVKGVGLLRKAW
ncbi:MAG: PLP-dependent aminotransferase family protein [Lachnospiraceae bacterium]|jgi:GntR family transcriptional regulator/MocR family aminotransferase|nr:PLP-dependent aminotransferase family protein [Lachnospiraceae bacterium]